MDAEELADIIRGVFVLIVLGIMLWYLKDVEPFRSVIKPVIDVAVFGGKIALGIVIIGIIGIVAYKIYSWREEVKLEEEMRKYEEEMRSKGFVRYVNAKGDIAWGTPDEAEKHNYLAKIVEAIKEFEPPKTYKKEVRYQDTLYAWLKSRFPDTKLEVQRGSSRPDIVVGIGGLEVAIEVKGPTDRRALNDIPNKLIRYPEHFDYVVVVLFELNTSERYFSEWYDGLKKRFPEVVVVVK